MYGEPQCMATVCTVNTLSDEAGCERGALSKHKTSLRARNGQEKNELLDWRFVRFLLSCSSTNSGYEHFFSNRSEIARTRHGLRVTTWPNQMEALEARSHELQGRPMGHTSRGVKIVQVEMMF